MTRIIGDGLFVHTSKIKSCDLKSKYIILHGIIEKGNKYVLSEVKIFLPWTQMLFLELTFITLLHFY